MRVESYILEPADLAKLDEQKNKQLAHATSSLIADTGYPSKISLYGDEELRYDMLEYVPDRHRRAAGPPRLEVRYAEGKYAVGARLPAYVISSEGSIFTLMCAAKYTYFPFDRYLMAGSVALEEAIMTYWPEFDAYSRAVATYVPDIVTLNGNLIAGTMATSILDLLRPEMPEGLAWATAGIAGGTTPLQRVSF